MKSKQNENLNNHLFKKNKIIKNEKESKKIKLNLKKKNKQRK